MILELEVLNILVLLSSTHTPPHPYPRTTARVPTTYQGMGGVFRVAPMPSTVGLPGTFILPAYPYTNVRSSVAL